MNSEASFAALCGVSPIEASSGKTRRRRLNRGGDRRANAVYHIALTRARGDQRTRDYLDRRTHPRHDPPRSLPLSQTLHSPRDLLPHRTAQPRRTCLANGLTNCESLRAVWWSLSGWFCDEG